MRRGHSERRRRAAHGCVGVALGLAAGLLALPPPVGAGEREAVSNPLLQDPDAARAGRRLYRQICILCHRKAGGRGPNIFRSALTRERFLRTVRDGRRKTQMPAFAERLSTEQIWQLHAFVMSRDHY